MPAVTCGYDRHVPFDEWTFISNKRVKQLFCLFNGIQMCFSAILSVKCTHTVKSFSHLNIVVSIKAGWVRCFKKGRLQTCECNCPPNSQPAPAGHGCHPFEQLLYELNE